MSITRRNRVNTAVLSAALEVHKELGPGLSREIYLECLCHELRLQGVMFRRNLEIPITYKDMRIQQHFHLDLLVENDFVVQVHHIDEIFPVHTEHLRTLLKLTGKNSGLLINFNVVKLIEGYRKVNFFNTK
jgi:GxxExxY protein